MLGLSAVPAKATQVGRVRPTSAEWPDDREWASLSREVEGRFEAVSMPDMAASREYLANPFYIREQAALTQSSGWLDAWESVPSRFAVKAANAADVSAAVRFAARHRLRVVVKGGGHSYVGGSCAPDSLLIWTRAMDAIRVHDSFVPEGSTDAPRPAVSVGAGCIWLNVYDAVTTHAGRYVQGGGCTTVGVAGLIQGGGFGSFSKTYGLAAAGLLEAEIVTADGKVRLVNGSRDPDLFWALKGGGGGTFGVVTRLTLRTHDLPKTLGALLWGVQAHSDGAFRRLIARFVDLYADTLHGPVWGEQVRMGSDNRMDVQMLFTGLDEQQAREAWSSLEDFVHAAPDDFSIARPLMPIVVAARHFWDADAIRANLPDAAVFDTRPGAGGRDFWWKGNTAEAGTYWRGFHSRWIPAALLATKRRPELVDAWFEASRHWGVTLHFNKGLAGASSEVLAAARATAINPDVADACALAIMAEDGPGTYPGTEPFDPVAGRRDAARIQEAANTVSRCAPGSGCYMSEADYHLAGWQRAFWGRNWLKLDRVKRRYDPNDLFIIHHGVGSERWSTDGFTRSR